MSTGRPGEPFGGAGDRRAALEPMPESSESPAATSRLDPQAGFLGRRGVPSVSALLRLPRAVPAALAVLHAALLWVLSSLTGDSFGDRGAWFPFVSNLAHAPMFGLLGLWVAASLAPRTGEGGGVFGWRRAAGAVTIAFAYACLDELHQRFVPGRASDPRDLVTDLVGITAGVLLVAASVRGDRAPALPGAILGLSLLACASAWWASTA